MKIRPEDLAKRASGHKGGRKFTPEAQAFRDLSNQIIKDLITRFKLSEIASKYDVSEGFVSDEISRRNLYEINDEKTYLRDQYKKGMFSPNEWDYGKGAERWSGSPESLFIKEFKKANKIKG